MPSTSLGGPPAGGAAIVPLTPLEVAAGLVLDPRRRPRPLPRAAGESPRAALEAVIRPALAHGPCLVSFSGGRDSSLVLAVAAAVARREGLPLPVPVTNRFPGAPATDESRWQEQVVGHLRLGDWVRLEHGDELDVVGPVARRVLRRHGLLWPCNAHFHVPIFERAAGGTVLTGVGGDEALSGSERGRALEVLRGRARPVPSDLRRVAYAAAPAALRTAVVAPALDVAFPWLRPRAARRVRRALAREAATQPLRWGRSFAWLHGARSLD
ncbi:MAG TPA: asparagine synthase-related protein, partial [Baekduia sp.]|nr:asparagine synthase-related protein [Baekduia sp.]